MAATVNAPLSDQCASNAVCAVPVVQTVEARSAIVNPPEASEPIAPPVSSVVPMSSANCVSPLR